MLPFLQPKKMAGVIIAKRKQDGTTMPEKEEGQASPEMMAMAESLISAIHSKDASAVAMILEEMMETDQPMDESDMEDIA